MVEGGDAVDLFIKENFPGFGKCIFRRSFSVKTIIFLSAETMVEPVGGSVSSSIF